MSMMNIDSVTAHLSKMSPQQLQQFASMHMDDPIMLAAAKFVSNQQTKMQQSQQPAPGTPPKVNEQTVASIAPQQMPQQQMPQQQMQPQAQQAPQQPQQPQAQQAPQQPQQPQMPPQAQGLPEDSGIAQLPAQNMQNMAEGGIVAFAGGGGPKKDAFAEALELEGITDPTQIAFLSSIYSQESSSGKKTTTSNRGAVGGMQVLPGTFRQVAPDLDINKPVDNIRGGVRYALQGLQAAKGDPVLAGAYYYGGPGGMTKAVHGIAVSDPKNPQAPTTLGYGKQVAARMASLMPIGTAQATPAPVPGAQPPAATTEEPSYWDRSKKAIVGAGTAGLAALGNAAAGAYEAVTPSFAPGTTLGKAVGRTAATAGPLAAVGMTGAGLSAGAANALSNATPEQLEQLQGDIGSDTGLAAAIMNPQNRGPEVAAKQMPSGQQISNAVKFIAKTAVMHPDVWNKPSPTAPAAEGIESLLPAGTQENRDIMRRAEHMPEAPSPADLPKAAQKEVIATAKENVPEGTNTKGFTNEDWLNLGFGLLAGKSQYAMQNLGEAGIATLAAKQARTKAGIEARKAEADITQSGAMSKYYGAAAERYADEDKPLAQARKELAAAYAKLETDELLKFDPAKLAAAKQRANAEIMARYPELKDTLQLGSAGPVPNMVSGTPAAGQVLSR